MKENIERTKRKEVRYVPDFSENTERTKRKEVRYVPDFTDDKSFAEATSGLKFTKDFNDAVEAVMHDSMATNGQRFLAWLKRRAWGNYSLHAVRDDGQPALQRDCAEELEISKQRISAVVSYYEQRGYVRIRGKLLYPVINPALGAPQKVPDGKDFPQFLEWWKVTSATDFQAFEVIDAEYKKQRLVQLAAYKKWRSSGTIAEPSLDKSFRELQDAEQTTTELSPEADQPASPEASVVVVSALSIREILRAWLTGKFAIPTKLEPDVFEEIAAHISDLQALEQFCEAVKDAHPRGWKYFIPIARSCAANRDVYAMTAASRPAQSGRSKSTQAALDLMERRIKRGEDPL